MTRTRTQTVVTSGYGADNRLQGLISVAYKDHGLGLGIGLGLGYGLGLGLGLG